MQKARAVLVMASDSERQGQPVIEYRLTHDWPSQKCRRSCPRCWRTQRKTGPTARRAMMTKS